MAWGELPGIDNPQAYGLGPQPIDEVDTGAASASFAGLGPGGQFQIRLLLPADIEGCVSLRAEEGGFWPRCVAGRTPSLHFPWAASPLISRADLRRLVPLAIEELCHAAGFPGTTTKYEVFFQDAYQPPKSLADRLLLFAGDPLFLVEVPWQPTSLIVDFAI